MPTQSKVLLFVITLIVLSSTIRSYTLFRSPAEEQPTDSLVQAGVMSTPPPAPSIVNAPSNRGPANVSSPVKATTIKELVAQQAANVNLRSPPLTSAELERAYLEVKNLVEPARWNEDGVPEETFKALHKLCKNGNAPACTAWLNEKLQSLQNSKSFQKLSNEEQFARYFKLLDENSSLAAYACLQGDSSPCGQGLKDPSLAGGRGVALLLAYCDSGSASYCGEAAKELRSQLGARSTGASGSANPQTASSSELEQRSQDLFRRGCDLGDANSCNLLIQNSSGPSDDPQLQMALMKLEDGCKPHRDPLSYLASCGTLSEFYLRAGNLELSKYFRDLGCEYGRKEMCQ